jgi:hypothetical protein
MPGITFKGFAMMNCRFMILRRRAVPTRALRALTSLAILTALACAQRGEAQVSASIKGVVTYSSGWPLASATVNAKNTETGATRNAITDDAGRYLLLSLSIGEYEVKVTKPGFREAIRTGIRLAVGQEASVDLTL